MTEPVFMKNERGDHIVRVGDKWYPTQLMQNEDTGERAYIDPMSQQWVTFKPEMTSDVVKGTARSVGEGLTFNYGGELEAGARAALGDRSYDEERKRIAAEQEKFSEKHPVLDIGGQLVGGALTGGVGAAKTLGSQAVRQAPRALRALAYPAVGAVEGAVAGSGTDEENRGRGAAIGAGIGATAATALPLAGMGAKKVYNAAATRLSPRARARTAEEFARRAAERDRLGVDDVVEGMKRKRGAPVDVGPNLERLGEYAAQTPGPALKTMSEFGMSRLGKRYKQIADTLESAVIPAGKQVMQRVELSPAFRQSLETVVPFTPRLQRYLSRPSLKTAWSKAQKLAAEDDIVVPPLNKLLSGEAKVVGVKTEWLHYLKKGLDDVIEPKRNAEGVLFQQHGKEMLKKLQDTRVAFRTLAKKLNPEYGKSLDAMSREFKLDEAFENGRKMMGSVKYGPPVIRRMMRKMSPEQRRMFQRGAIEGTLEKIAPKAEVGDDITKQVALQIPKLRQMFGDKGDEVAGQLLSQVEKMRVDNRMLHGSATSQRLATKQDVEGGMVGDLLTTGVPGTTTMGNAAIRAFNRFIDKPSQKTMDELAKLLTSEDPAVVRAAFERAVARRAKLMSRGARGLGYGSMGAATVSGSNKAGDLLNGRN